MVKDLKVIGLISAHLKANSMTKAQIRSAVQRKRAAGNPGGKPTMVRTMARKKKK